MTGFQSRFLEYDTCINFLILNIECDSCCYRVVGRYVLLKRKLVNEDVQHCVPLRLSGIRDFHFLPLVNNFRQG